MYSTYHGVSNDTEPLSGQSYMDTVPLLGQSYMAGQSLKCETTKLILYSLIRVIIKKGL
jgi:hypothetical protein